jgi:hypothetical protein
MHDNDELEGLSWPSFIELINDIYAFQYVNSHPEYPPSELDENYLTT